MSRFDRLEFEPPRSSASPPSGRRRGLDALPLAEAEPDRDERHWLKQAVAERRNGNHEAALRYYSRALELDRSLLAGWVGQVQMLIALDEAPEAELWSRKALELFKNNAELLAGRCQALCRTGDLKSAQASGDAAINQQGSAAYPWIARGELMLARREDLDDYCFDKAICLDVDPLLPLEIGDIYLHYRRGAKALKHFRRATELAPDQPHFWYRQGQCQQSLGLIGPALQSYRQCLQLQPSHASARHAFEEVNQGKGVFGKIRRWFGPA